MISKDKSAEPMADMNEQCVPTAALEVDGTAPAEGDEVEFSVKGKVTRAEGGNTYVNVTAINGQDVSKDEPEAQGNDEEGGDEDMMNAAKKADGDSGY
jgi:hypothetical protein